MANERFSISAAFRYGWDAFKKHAGVLIGFVVAVTLVSLAINLTLDKLIQPPGTAAWWMGRIFALVVGWILGMAVLRVSLTLYDQDQPGFNSLGELASLLGPYLANKFVYTIIVTIGFILLIVPGVIAFLMFFFAGYVLIDHKTGPIDALKESMAITTGVKLDLFFFWILLVLMNLAGFVCLIVGLFITVPISLMATVYVYRQLSPAGETPAETV